VPKLNVQGIDSWLTDTESHSVFERASFPVAEISSTAGVLANVHMNPDSDSVYRRAALFEILTIRFCRHWRWQVICRLQPDIPLKIYHERLMLGDSVIPVE